MFHSGLVMSYTVYSQSIGSNAEGNLERGLLALPTVKDNSAQGTPGGPGLDGQSAVATSSGQIASAGNGTPGRDAHGSQY